jgi:adenosine deaminase
MGSILLTTFGATWQVVPELLGFTNPGFLHLYANHPHLEQIERTRKDYEIKPVEEIWLVTTKGSRTDESIAKLNKWYNLTDKQKRPGMQIWQVADAEDLKSEAECRRMGECIHRVFLRATEYAGKGQLLVSLTGGRKTMSSDIQNAAAFFGCSALIHVIQNEFYRDQLMAYSPEDFLIPLPEVLYDAITPLIAGKYAPNHILDVSDPGRDNISSEAYPVELPDRGSVIEQSITDYALSERITESMKEAGFLYSNYINTLMRQEKSANFLALYSLPPSIIERLKNYSIGTYPEKRETELAWLKKLPKSELHCHLGGLAHVTDLIEIAASNLEKISQYDGQLEHVKQELRKYIDNGDIKDLRKLLPFAQPHSSEDDIPGYIRMSSFILMFEDIPDMLDEVIFGPYRDESQFCGIGFDAYERLGDIQGSGLLQSEAAIRAACGVLKKRAGEHNVRYLELRCSPVNYTKGGLSASRVARIIDDEMRKSGGPEYSLIFIASRHGEMQIVHKHIELAGALLGRDGAGFPNFRGFDLAGNERVGSMSAMRREFMSMMERCMHFTIHAGETEGPESIWEAVYHLNAERVGHGLTLRDNPMLQEKILDRNIALEMCPSSNFQIVGFRDTYLPGTKSLEIYPLKEYLDEGLRVTVNTDNPGISRTDFTREIHRAARLTPGGLTLWDILLCVRNGFRASFAKKELRQQMLRSAESSVIALIKEGLPE